MAKNRSKKKRDDAVSMDVSESKSVSEATPEAMDTAETGDAKLAARSRNLTSTVKGKPMKRTKNLRKLKAVAKAIALNENYSETGDEELAAHSHNLTSTRKGKPMKRTMNVRKKKAVAKAIALKDKYEEKASKNVTKSLRTLSAKTLYE